MRIREIGALRDFTKPELDHFRENANFTDDERAYFELKARDKTIAQIAMEMCCSESKVSKVAKRVRDKILRLM